MFTVSYISICFPSVERRRRLCSAVTAWKINDRRRRRRWWRREVLRITEYSGSVDHAHCPLWQHNSLVIYYYGYAEANLLSIRRANRWRGKSLFICSFLSLPLTLLLSLPAFLSSIVQCLDACSYALKAARNGKQIIRLHFAFVGHRLGLASLLFHWKKKVISNSFDFCRADKKKNSL